MENENKDDKVREVMKILKDVLIEERGINVWLNTPLPELGDRTPRWCIDNGYVGAVLTILHNAIEGIPA